MTKLSAMTATSGSANEAATEANEDGHPVMGNHKQQYLMRIQTTKSLMRGMQSQR